MGFWKMLGHSFKDSPTFCEAKMELDHSVMKITDELAILLPYSWDIDAENEPFVYVAIAENQTNETVDAGQYVQATISIDT
eukprot:CAMPEP_0202971540 /NCGR_PEP_ID=MMETSP1396-20130829/28348_1 /ASSEMBLY_ACC=CAM_ASM_000872 /TAXON_ID= /ORGANISM="Pseudokeronopsis sp., Strain Brazil" /LENGTH=80 /DNA_ID=CAMNT_0049701021 /DNA_START=957 /DNA_END=1199 /DNA_ORIENTATION=-